MFITELKTLCNIGDRIHDAQCVVDKIADFILTVCISQKTEPLVEMGIKSSVSLLYRLSPFMLPTQILFGYRTTSV